MIVRGCCLDCDGGCNKLPYLWVDALNFPNPLCMDSMVDALNSPISGLHGVISLVVHSRVEYQSSDQLKLAYSRKFSSYLTTHTSSFFGVNLGFANASYDYLFSDLLYFRIYLLFINDYHTFQNRLNVFAFQKCIASVNSVYHVILTQLTRNSCSQLCVTTNIKSLDMFILLNLFNSIIMSISVIGQVTRAWLIFYIKIIRTKSSELFLHILMKS